MAIDRAKVSKQAEAHLASGRLDRAVDEFMKLLDENPRDYALMNRIGDIYLQANKLNEAVDMFKRGGMGFERDGFSSKASAVFKKAHKIVPDDVDVSGRLADLYRQTNMIKEAIAIHIEVADHFTKKGLLKRALDEFSKVVELDPKNLKNKVKLADLYNKEGMKERAASIYLEVAEALAVEQMHAEANQILERAKVMVTTPQVFLTQSRLCVIQKDLAGAANHLREGLVPNPRSSELLEALAEIELQSKNPEKALEALGQIAQLPEKMIPLCERAMRDMAKTGRVSEALALFKPIGRDFSRRGNGEIVSRALQNALQGYLNAEAWLQLAEIAHQEGNRPQQIDFLKRAHASAKAASDNSTLDNVAKQLTALGVSQDQMEVIPAATQVAPAPHLETGSIPGIETTGTDPVKRMQINQLQRDGESYLRNRFMDRAQDAFQKILELDPVNTEAINRIADIIKASGKMTAVQVHYVKTAEKLANMGHRRLAVEMLDKAETLFPGSTRLYRRTLGLIDVQAPPAAPVETQPASTAPTQPPAGAPIAIALDGHPGIPTPIPAPPPIPMPSDLDVLIALDQPGAPATGPFVPPGPSIPSAPPIDARALQTSDLNLEELQDIEGLELEPLSFAEGKVPKPPPGYPPVALPAAGPLAPPPVPLSEELESILSDIDFQMDYGSPDEAKIEIENALKTYPNHPELLKRLDQAEESLRKLGHVPSTAAAKDSDLAHSFFDLTDVLGDALLETGEGEEMHDATNVVEKIQSVDELFNAFREGVEQQVKVDDYDTHYNLGIAYKEMMLIEPALEEFKKAMRDPERTLECCSMLAICEHSQGHLEAAEQWLQTGIQAPGFPPEDSIGLRYDLGELYLQMGRQNDARTLFQSVHSLDPEYREVAQRLR